MLINPIEVSKPAPANERKARTSERITGESFADALETLLPVDKVVLGKENEERQDHSTRQNPHWNQATAEHAPGSSGVSVKA